MSPTSTKVTQSMLAPNEQEGMEEEQEELKVEQELPIKLYNGHRTGEGTLMNPAFFPNLMQLHQPNMNSGMSMPNMDYGAFPMQPPLEFLFGPAYNMFVAAALPYANPFQMQFPPAASSFPTTHSNPVVPSQIDNEVNEFLDTVLDSPTKVPASTKVYTPTKPPRASSPLPSSTPRAPRAMLEQAGCLTPTKYTSTKPSPISTTRTTPRVSPLKLGSVFYPSARLAKEPVLPRASDDCRGLTRAARPVPKSTSTPQCYNCLAQDHTTTECGVRCPHCKQDGHKPRHCNYRTLIDGTTVRNSFTIPGSQLRPDYIKKASNKTVGNCASRTVVDASTSHDGSEIRFRQRPHNTEEAKEKIDVRIAKPPRQPQVPMLRRQKKRYNLKTQSDVNSQPFGFKNERGESYLSLGERDRGREWEWDWDWERGGERQRWSREEEERARWRARRDRDMRRYH